MIDEPKTKSNSRHCRECTLCCKLLPMPEMQKAAGERCKHQRAGKGCMIYAKRPPQCQLWSCRWLADPEATAELRRPDRSHYVIDLVPDYITARDGEGAEPLHIEVVQVWIDPDYPDAHRDPALRSYLAKLGERGCAALIRYDAMDAFTLLPPAMAGDGQWHEVRSAMREKTHTAAEKAAALGGDFKVTVSVNP
jgi:hypothetical protein